MYVDYILLVTGTCPAVMISLLFTTANTECLMLVLCHSLCGEMGQA